jgi:hypothetical protein
MDDIVFTGRTPRSRAAAGQKQPRGGPNKLAVVPPDDETSCEKTEIVNEDRSHIEGHPPLIDMFFDEECYLVLNKDVRNRKGNDASFDAKSHFVSHGRQEGRSPSYLFDVDYVLRYVAKVDGLELPNGEALPYFERLPAARRFVPNNWFNPNIFRNLYTTRYSGLASQSDYEVFLFYVTYVAHHQLSPNGLFNEAAYVECYPDVAIAVATGSMRSGFMHFMTHGCDELRLNLPGFIADARPNGLRQREFLLGKSSEFDRLLWWFDEAFYLSVYDDVHALRRRGRISCGLEHFLTAGFAEGRVPHPCAFDTLQKLARAGVVHANGWDFAAKVADLSPASPNVDLKQAARLLAFLDPPAKRRPTVLSALWTFIEPPVLGGSCDAGNYLRLNPDLERILGSDALRQAEHHWRNDGVHEHRPFMGSNLYDTREIDLADATAWKSGVNFFGPLSISNGLGSAARGYVAALRHAGIPRRLL